MRKSLIPSSPALEVGRLLLGELEVGAELLVVLVLSATIIPSKNAVQSPLHSSEPALVGTANVSMPDAEEQIDGIETLY